MKKLLLTLLLASGATVMANNADSITEKQEKKLNAAQAAHAATKETTKAAKTIAIIKPETTREDNTSHIAVDNSRYGLGAYIVEFINRHNVKIMRKILID